jgi:DNA modification methylase
MTGSIVPLPEPTGLPRRRRPTATSRFGVGRRESHDASGFYDRFPAPIISDDKVLGTRRHPVDVLVTGDARCMDQVDDATVALVVTSPPYFAGKEYEEALGEGHVPESYQDYLEMLTDVFAECVAKLEPGGRIAVNVANLGRRPYRSLSADVTDILQNRLRLLLRGEVIWWKGRGAGGSCAWGSFQRPGNPVLRDLTERVVVASKGRFDRALTARQRLAQGRPSTATISRDEFMEATTDLWELAPESANRVGHPAPFPVELPQRLIDLYTYEDDLVLDPFAGSGTTAVAAVRTGRHYVGYDTDEAYIVAARARVADEIALRHHAEGRHPSRRASLPALPTETTAAAAEDAAVQAVGQGRKAKEVALLVLEQCGFTDVRIDVRFPARGVDVSFMARDAKGEDWAFDVSGGFTTTRSGLRKSDTLWKALGKAAVLHQAHPELPLVLLTTDVPAAGSPGDAALRAVRGAGRPVRDVIEILDPEGQARLRRHAGA